MQINKPEFISKILINVLFITTFITFFFFTYGIYKEQQIVKYQMIFLSEYIKDVFDINDELKLIINNFKIMENDDQRIVDSNNEVLISTCKIIPSFIIFISIIIYYINNKYNINLKNIIMQNIIILIFIACTEFSVLTFFGSKFINIDPNKIKLYILENLHKNNII